MKKTSLLLTVASVAVSFLTLAGLAFAVDESPTPSPTPHKRQCRSIPNKLRALNKQLAQQNAKQVRTQAKLDEVLAKIAALPTPTPLPSETASPTPIATPTNEHGKGHEHSQRRLS